MFGISSKIAIGEFLILLLVVAAGYFYYQFTQNEIVTLKVNAAQLQTAVQTQKDTIQSQINATALQNSAMLSLQQKSDAAEDARRVAEDSLRKHNLDALARNNAAVLETHLNQATVKAFLDIEHLTDPNVKVDVNSQVKK
jgi:hypothetical protein